MSQPDLSDFARYCNEHQIATEEMGAAFAAWLNEKSGWDGPVRQVDEPQ